MTGRPLRTLHIDIEGGWGGSSRSLFELVSRLNRARIEPLIAHRQDGPLTDWYAGIGVRTVRVPEIASYVPRQTKALKNWVASWPRLARIGRGTRRLAHLIQAEGIDLIHANYEGLFLMVARLRRQTGVPVVAHSRAHMPLNGWARWVARTLARNVDHMLFISPNEERRFAELAGPGTSGEVMWNIGRPAPPRRAFADPPEAVYFGSVDFSKGTDRLVDVAAALDALGAPPLVIAVYGKARTDAAFAKRMEARIAAEGLGHRIEMRGYTTEPMAAMAGALALIRPSRDDDPWGRDVIEATLGGLPVIATGSFDGVVRPGDTGYLLDPFDPALAARRLAGLATDPDEWARLSEAARCRGAERFSGTAQAARFTEIVEDLAGQA